MNRFIFHFSLLILVLFVLIWIHGTSLSLAGIPKLINYQGMLTDNSGNPLTDTVSITFKIYDDPSSGNKKWEETQSGVPVINGLFNVILGSVTPIDTLSFEEQYWLDITVDAEHMPDRLRFTSVGYAYRAQRADTADYARVGGGGSGSPWIFWITDGSDTTISTGGGWGIARYGNTLYGTADSTHVNLGVACTTGTSGLDIKYCTVGGGVFNTARGWGATVGGGDDNTAGGCATVGGGAQNTASGASTVGGGWSNTANNWYATVGGGYSNTASGYNATVPGGENNTASGDFSFAAGCKAKALHSGAFVWADSTDADFASTKTNQFSIRARNGLRLASDAGSSKTIVIGERYRDNAVVAWGNVAGDGSVQAEFGVSSVTRTSAGNYTIDLDASAASANTLIPVASAEVDAIPTTAANARLIYVDQADANTFKVYITNGSYTAFDNEFTFIVTAR